MACVCAAASAPSFRLLSGVAPRERSLQELREQAALHLKAVLARADDPAITVAELSVDRRAGSKPARASSTDPEAHPSGYHEARRVMKMGDGGFRPAMNVQMATAGDAMGGPHTIVAVAVNNVGSDMGALIPMVAQIEKRTVALPEHLLADANHANHEASTALAARGVDVLVPVPERTRKDGGSSEIEAWKARMQTPDAKERYRARRSV